MNLISILSLILFFAFLMSYISKLVILKKKSGITALVLAKGNKGKSVDFAELLMKITTFLWGLAWLLESLFNQIISNYLGGLFESDIVSYLGLLIITLGLVFFILSMSYMKESWRVGIDKSTKTKLVTLGIYRYSRNPAFVGFNLMFLGLFLTFPNMITLVIFLINSLATHTLILQEEKHLEEVFQREYLDYKDRTPRYFIL